MLAVQLAVGLLVNVVQGTLADEFRSVDQWGFTVGVAAASLAMVLIIRSKRLDPSALVRFGLVYQVVVSFGIAGGLYHGAFEGVPAESIRFDRTGITFVGPWMLLFSVLVPAPLRETTAALFASAAAVPVLYLAQVHGGLAPPLAWDAFALIFVLPYLLIAVLSAVASRVVHNLGAEVRRAYEMGSYKLEALLGRGGMGEVWRATHHMLARPAAIKLIRPEAFGEDPAVAEARFEREAQAIASLESPNTVALYDFGSTSDGTLYYVMELLDGVDLEELVKRHGPLPPERVVHVLRQAAASLEEAHARSIVHRDIKPANIALCRRALEHDVVKVLDFGLAKRVAGQANAAAAHFTQPEFVVGTPAYLAPEIALGGPVDGRADLYSLGCVAFWLLTGRLVFEAATPAAMIVAHAHDAPLPPSHTAPHPVPEALDRVVLECLSKDPGARPPSAGALGERLAGIALAKPWTARDAAAWWERNLPSSA
jgi:serine/threonine-protein kinase